MFTRKLSLALPFLFSLIGLCACLCLAAPEPAPRDAVDMSQALSELTQKVLPKVKGQKEVNLDFTAPKSVPAGVLASAASLLTANLKAANVAVNVAVRKEAAWTIKSICRIEEVEVPGGKQKILALLIDLLVLDEKGKEVDGLHFRRVIKAEAALLEVTGVPAEIALTNSRPERNKSLLAALAKPHSYVNDSGEVAAAVDSPYHVQVLVARKPLEVKTEGGLAFVRMPKDTVYEVRLVNGSADDAAVRLSIDGLGLFTFSEERYVEGPNKGLPLHQVVIVPKKGEQVIHGWPIRGDEARQFKVTPFPESAAAGRADPEKAGTITASFAAAWPPDGDAPKHEPMRAQGSTDLGTGFGEKIRVPFVKDQARETGVIRASVSVRYRE